MDGSLQLPLRGQVQGSSIGGDELRQVLAGGRHRFEPMKPAEGRLSNNRKAERDPRALPPM
jgi:hypothetical protein